MLGISAVAVIGCCGHEKRDEDEEEDEDEENGKAGKCLLCESDESAE